jgi:hypothetical protein
MSPQEFIHLSMSVLGAIGGILSRRLIASGLTGLNFCFVPLFGCLLAETFG